MALRRFRCGAQLESTMSILSKGYGRRIDLCTLAILVLGIAFAAPARAETDTVTINVDQAQIMTLPDRVATIVIGNPLIADATLQNGGVLVVTGKGYGATNLLALDRGGRVLMEKTIQVTGPGTKDLVVVYRGVEREIVQLRADVPAPNHPRRLADLFQRHAHPERNAQRTGPHRCTGR